MTSREQLGISTRSRATARLSKTLEKDLVAYIAAATAVGVGAMALSHPAEAKIIYTKTNVQITNGLGLDLNNDGITDFTFKVSDFTSTTTFCPCSSNLIKPAQSGNQIWGKKVPIASSYAGLASALQPGVTVRASKKLQASHTWMCHSSGKFGEYGYWFKVDKRYLGLKFYVNGQAHYGWARANFPAGCTSGTLTGYAYETVANRSIKTGRTKGPDIVTVERGTLGHLALGASAIPARRKTNSVAASQ